MLYKLIKEAYKGQLQKTVLHIGSKCWSAQELFSAVDRQADIFLTQGCKPGDITLILLPTGWHAVVVMLAAAKIGLVVAPLPMSSTESSFIAALHSLRPKSVIVWHPLLSMFDTHAKGVIWLQAGSESNLVQPAVKGGATVEQKTNDLQSFSICEDSPYILTMTSGSTGNPKPIELSQRTKYLRARSAISLYQLSSDDITLIATPLYHSLALRLLFVGLLSGGALVIMPNYHPEQWLQAVEQHKVTFTIAVSSQLQKLIHADLTKAASINTLVSSSALLSAPIKQALIDKLHCSFHECYGASEVAIVSDIKFGVDKPTGSVGKPISGIDVKIISQDGSVAPVNTIGEICIKSPYVCNGYYQLPDVTHHSFSGEYFKTGDLGYFDAQGYLFYSGRLKEMIITGGINVYPQDIEQAIERLEPIKEVVAFPYPDTNLGEVVAIAYVTKDGYKFDETLASFELINTLLDFQLPRKWFPVDKIPKTSLGKVQRYHLAKHFANNAGHKYSTSSECCID